MTTKHTPGPWHIGMCPGPIVYGPQGEQVANMLPCMLERDEHNANARLIAAAPDMLAALETIADHLAKSEKFAAVEYSDELLVPYSDIEKYARAAIAKATGNAST